MPRTDNRTPASRMVHELGNLLAVAVAQAEYLLNDEDQATTARERRESLESIRQAALHARETVRRLSRTVRESGTVGGAYGAVVSGLVDRMRPGDRLRLDLERRPDAVLIAVPPSADIPHAAISAAGGSLDVREVPGGEAALEVRLPLPGARPSAPAARRTGAARVLVIDDDAECRDGLAALLGETGHDVETAATGAEGIERYRRRRFDCVVTDLTMPGLGGLVVSRAIKDHDPGAWVVVLRGVADDADPRAVQAAGVDRVVPKPVSRDDICGLVERAPRPGPPGAP